MDVCCIVFRFVSFSCVRRFLILLDACCSLCLFLSSLILFLSSFSSSFLLFSISANLTLSMASSLVKLSPVPVSPCRLADRWRVDDCVDETRLAKKFRRCWELSVVGGGTFGVSTVVGAATITASVWWCCRPRLESLCSGSCNTKLSASVLLGCWLAFWGDDKLSVLDLAWWRKGSE